MMPTRRGFLYWPWQAVINLYLVFAYTRIGLQMLWGLACTILFAVVGIPRGYSGDLIATLAEREYDRSYHVWGYYLIITIISVPTVLTLGEPSDLRLLAYLLGVAVATLLPFALYAVWQMPKVAEERDSWSDENTAD